MFILKLISATVLVSAVLSADIECDPCQCETKDCFQIEADCSIETIEYELGEIPGNFTDTIDVLDLSGQPLKTLKGHVFQIANLTELKSLTIKNCQISEINKTAFSNMTKLKHLDASSNNISVIENEAIVWLTQLQKLDLSQNMIKKIPDIQVLTRLTEVILNHNNIQFIDDKTFANNSEVDTLHLSHNKIETVSGEAFASLKKLKYLHISNNNLTRLPENLFENNLKLHVLQLENNTIVNIPSLRNLSNLAVFDLNSNKIRVIPEDLFTNKSHLFQINLGRNEIKEIPKNVFANLTLLHVLDLSYNKIKQLDSRLIDNTNCKVNTITILVHLDHNNINKIPSHFFGKTCSRLYVDLSFNNISTIDENAFNNSDVGMLDLSHNQISFLYQNTFRHKVHSLHLSDNKLTVLPDKIFVDMFILKMDNNNLKTLSNKWFDVRSLPIFHVSADNNNITYFDVTDKQIFDVNLVNNPLICDCNLREQFKMYRHSSIQCQTPKPLQGLTWEQLNLEQFACAPKLLENLTETNNGITSKIAFKVYGSPAPKIRWVKNNVTVLDNDTTLIKTTLDQANDVYWYNLTFSNKTTVSGNFFCEMSNFAGVVKMNFTVQRAESSAVHVGTAIGITALVLVLIGLHVLLVLFYFKRLKRNPATSTESTVPYENAEADEHQAMV